MVINHVKNPVIYNFQNNNSLIRMHLKFIIKQFQIITRSYIFCKSDYGYWFNLCFVIRFSDWFREKWRSTVELDEPRAKQNIRSNRQKSADVGFRMILWCRCFKQVCWYLLCENQKKKHNQISKPFKSAVEIYPFSINKFLSFSLVIPFTIRAKRFKKLA